MGKQRCKSLENQAVFDFEAMPSTPVSVDSVEVKEECVAKTPLVVDFAPQPEKLSAQMGKRLTLDGHKEWRDFCHGMQEHIIGMAAKQPEHAKEYAEIAKSWKEQAAKHQRAIFAMEETLNA